MTAEDVNRKVRDMARAFPNEFKLASMVPLLREAYAYAVAWQGRAQNAGLGGAMKMRMGRIATLLTGPYKATPDLVIRNGQTALYTDTFNALTGPYIESAGIIGDEQSKVRAWTVMVDELAALPRAIAKGVKEAVDLAAKAPWKWLLLGGAVFGAYTFGKRYFGDK